MTKKTQATKSSTNTSNGVGSAHAITSAMEADFVRAGDKQENNEHSAKAAPGFRVVGIGASAGGLEALTQLFQSVPRDPGLAFILVQHLAPDHKSALVHLLTQQTSMQVAEAVEGVEVQSNCVYIIPPDRQLAIANGRLRLSAFAKSNGANMSIDFFFMSLAEDQGAAAIGVILSGAGGDGALGLKAIREAGGITFAQDEESAKFPSMPHSAVSTGSADIVLPPAGIAKELVRIAATMIMEKPAGKDREKTDETVHNSMNQIFTLLVRQCGVDFTYYKQSTVVRRVERRMLLLRLHEISAYIDHLKQSPAEIDALYDDILINVTRFFRDKEVFEALATSVFPAILKDRDPGLPIRVWVPGCSTGEEVYSLAIGLLESMTAAKVVFPLQIFGSDIDESAIAQARIGIFPLAISNDVSEERLEKYFIRVESGYQIKKFIRDRCIFSKQNVVKDPPFSNLDLVSCRNVLIYFEPPLQKRAISVFHYALKPTGFLLLGSAEGIGGHADLFKLIDQKSRIHVKKSIATPLRLDFGRFESSDAHHDIPVEKRVEVAVDDRVSIQREVDRVLLQKYCPAAVVINEQIEILYFHGDTAAYLQQPAGEASLNLLKMARGNLMLELQIATNKAIMEDAAVIRKKVQFREGAHRSMIDIEVTPLRRADNLSPCFLVLFREAAGAHRQPRVSSDEHEVERVGDQAMTELMHELAATKEYLQSTIAQHDAVSGELSSTSEELQSSNEELQSMNEELESAKEELQSSNEELVTVNDELERRNLELMHLNDDLANLVDSASMPTVMVDRNLCIRRFTPQVTTLLNLISGDIGRPLNNIKINMATVEFEQVLREVIKTAKRKDIEAQDDSGHWYSINFYPYKAADNSVDGAIMVFVDIDRMKRSYEAASDARDFAEAVITAAPRPLLVLDKDLRVVAVSRSYLEVFSVTEKDTVGNLLYYLGNGQWGIPKLREALEKTLASGVCFDEFEVEHSFEKVGEMRVKVSGRYIAPGAARPSLIYMQIERE